jgi:peptidoglycan hydrolase-like protein with peptidoglycan-binding domain
MPPCPESLPDTGAFRTAPADIAVHPSGWHRLSPTVEVTRLPLWDSRHDLAARPGWGPADEWLRAKGWRMPTVAEMQALHAASQYVAPFTMPTVAMLSGAGIPLSNTKAIDAYRNAHMMSHRWAALHDAEVWRRLDAAKWDGVKPVANFGKQWCAPAGTIFGWRLPDGSFIQNTSKFHATERTYGDYATTVFAARDVSPQPPGKAPSGAPPSSASHPPPTKLGDRGQAVTAWQRHLLAHGYKLPRFGADGDHGAETERATQEWRADHDDQPTRPDLVIPPMTAEFRIVPSHEWGAAPPRSGSPQAPAKGVVLHHMALGAKPGVTGTNRQPGATMADELAQAFKLARNVQASHMAGRGWIDTGQHFSVSKGGVVLEGRVGSLKAAELGMVVTGAHCSGKNTDHWGIEIEGDYTHSVDIMPAQQWGALVELVAWLQARSRIGTLPVTYHRKYAATGCPGKVVDRIPALNAEVASRLGK